MKTVVQKGADILREVAKPMPKKLFGSVELARLISDMAKALDKETEGVALAAPQVGVSYRLFIVRKDRAVPVSNQGQTLNPNSQGQTLVTQKPDVQVYINPEILKTSRRKALRDEGCLSTKGIYGITKRHERVTISAYNIDGSRFQRGAGGLMAQIFEHEIDHLNGILFSDDAEQIVHITHDNESKA